MFKFLSLNSVQPALRSFETVFPYLDLAGGVLIVERVTLSPIFYPLNQKFSSSNLFLTSQRIL